MVSGKKGEIESRYIHWLPGGCNLGENEENPTAK